MCLYIPKKISEDEYLIEKRISFLGLFGVKVPVETVRSKAQVKKRIDQLKNKKHFNGIFSFFIW